MATREPSKIVRQNPVPPGRYWVDVPFEKFAVWDKFVEANKGALQIDHDERTFRTVDNDPTKGFDHWFIVFLTAPLSWPKGMGRPNTAPAWVTTRSDVYQRPEDPREHPIDTTATAVKETAKEGLSALASLFEDLQTVAFVGLVLYYLYKKGD